MQLQFEQVIFTIIAVAIVWFIYRMIKHGGFKAAMFGAGIKNTLGQVSGSGPKLINSSLRVHALDKSPERAVGIEFISKSIGSYQMTPITLSATEARKLAEFIGKAINS